MPVPYALLGTFFDGIMGMSNRNRQMALAQADLNERRRAAHESEKLAKASRTDAYGNKTYFDGEGFQTDVAPIIRAILDAQSREQLASLREDAPRARAAAVRKDARSKTADDLYEKVFAELATGRQKGEEEFQNEDFLAALDATRDQGEISLIDAVRSGIPSAIKNVQKAAAQSGRPSIAMLKNLAQRSGSQAFTSDVNSKDGIAFNKLNQLRAIAGDTDAANPILSNMNEELSGRQDQALAGLMQAVMNGAQMKSGGIQNMQAASATKGIDFGSIFNALEQEYGKTPEEKALEEWMMQQQLTGAQFGTADNIMKMRNLFKQNEGMI